MFGGIGGIGQVLGQSCKVLGHLGKIAKIIPTVSKVSGGISLGMAGFDLLSLGVSLFDPKSPLVQFNKKLHESSLYNGFQMTISVLAVFTAGFTKGMKNPIFAGIAPISLSSAGKGTEKASQQGNRRLQATIYFLAVQMIQVSSKGTPRNPAFRAYYERRLAEGKNVQQVLICISRRLLNIIYGMLKRGTVYRMPEVKESNTDSAKNK